MNRIRTMFVVLAAALAAGCGSDDARLTVLLKDAPSTDVKQAWVTITDINLVGSNGITRLGPSNPSSVTVDLLTLAKQTAKLVDQVVVAPGNYTELRIVLAGGCIQLASGTWYVSPNAPSQCESASGVLRMPSMGQSGLKVTMSGNALNVAPGSSGVLLVDFDVAQSFGVEAGNSGAWVMHPVITGGDFAISANVVATVARGATLPTTVDLGSCTVWLTSTTDSTLAPISATLVMGTDPKKDAQLYPPAGTYTTALECSAVNLTSVTRSWSDPLTVYSGQSTPITFTIEAVTAK